MYDSLVVVAIAMSHSNTNTNPNTNCTTLKMYWLYAGPSCDVSFGYLQDNANHQPTEIIIHSWALVSKMVIGVGDEFDSYESTNKATYKCHG